MFLLGVRTPFCCLCAATRVAVWTKRATVVGGMGLVAMFRCIGYGGQAPAGLLMHDGVTALGAAGVEGACWCARMGVRVSGGMAREVGMCAVVVCSAFCLLFHTCGCSTSVEDCTCIWLVTTVLVRLVAVLPFSIMTAAAALTPRMLTGGVARSWDGGCAWSCRQRPLHCQPALGPG